MFVAANTGLDLFQRTQDKHKEQSQTDHRENKIIEDCQRGAGACLALNICQQGGQIIGQADQHMMSVKAAELCIIIDIIACVSQMT